VQEECEPQEECEAGVPAWVMTFADLMSLLMCFFVLLLSFSEMDAQKFRQVAGSVKMAFGVQRQIEAMDPPLGTSLITKEYTPGKPQPTVIKVVQQKTIDHVRQNPERLNSDSESVKEIVMRMIDRLDEEIEEGLLEILVEDERLLVRINERGSFGSGSARLQPEFGPVLTKIAQVLNDSPGKIIVSGHTDNIPIRTRQFPSNWVLSAARAASVVHHITHHGLKDQSRIQIRAFADSKPIVPNTSPANRARNRRIEINIDTALDDADTVFEQKDKLGHADNKTMGGAG